MAGDAEDALLTIGLVQNGPFPCTEFYVNIVRWLRTAKVGEDGYAPVTDIAAALKRKPIDVVNAIYSQRGTPAIELNEDGDPRARSTFGHLVSAGVDVAKLGPTPKFLPKKLVLAISWREWIQARQQGAVTRPEQSTAFVFGYEEEKDGGVLRPKTPYVPGPRRPAVHVFMDTRPVQGRAPFVRVKDGWFICAAQTLPLDSLQQASHMASRLSLTMDELADSVEPDEPRAAGGPGEGAGAGQVCHRFQREGSCKYGDACKFEHRRDFREDVRGQRRRNGRSRSPRAGPVGSPNWLRTESGKLASLLRHRATEFGVHQREDGGIRIREAVEALRSRLEGSLTEDNFHVLVKNSLRNEKPRFELDGDFVKATPRPDDRRRPPARAQPRPAAPDAAPPNAEPEPRVLKSLEECEQMANNLGLYINMKEACDVYRQTRGPRAAREEFEKILRKDGCEEDMIDLFFESAEVAGA